MRVEDDERLTAWLKKNSEVTVNGAFYYAVVEHLRLLQKPVTKKLGMFLRLGKIPTETVKHESRTLGPFQEIDVQEDKIQIIVNGQQLVLALYKDGSGWFYEEKYWKRVIVFQREVEQ